MNARKKYALLSLLLIAALSIAACAGPAATAAPTVLYDADANALGRSDQAVAATAVPGVDVASAEKPDWAASARRRIAPIA